MINDCLVPVLSSAIDFLFELEPRPTLRGVRVQCFQTAKGYGNASSVRGKKRAIGWILQLLCGRTASVPHGEHEAPCGLFWVCSNTHTECLCSLMYRLMYTRALLQSEDHSVGSKRYLSRLEKRVESFASPRDEA